MCGREVAILLIAQKLECICTAYENFSKKDFSKSFYASGHNQYGSSKSSMKCCGEECDFVAPRIYVEKCIPVTEVAWQGNIAKELWEKERKYTF